MIDATQEAAPLPSDPPARDHDLAALDAAKLYGEILAAIRTTDDTSFKLHGWDRLVSTCPHSSKPTMDDRVSLKQRLTYRSTGRAKRRRGPVS